MSRRSLGAATIAVLTSLTFAAAPAFSQGSTDWTRPPDYVVSPQPSGPASPAMLGPITFSESEFPLSTTVNGLAVSSVGGSPLPATLSFSFTSNDATVSVGPGMTVFVSDPSIEGDANGTLTIDFGTDVTRVAFGFAQSCGAGNPGGATVDARTSGGSSVGSTTVLGQDLGFFYIENEVDFAPGTPFRTVEVSFDTAGGPCSRFVLDNLAYDALSVPAMPPDGVLALAVALLLAACWMLRRRRVQTG